MYHSLRKIIARFCEATEVLVLPSSIDVVAKFSPEQISLTKTFFILSFQEKDLSSCKVLILALVDMLCLTEICIEIGMRAHQL